MIDQKAVALVALLSLAYPSSVRGDNAHHSQSHLFGVGQDGQVTDDSSIIPPHKGCATFLTTNHEDQRLPSVNFRGKNKAGDAAEEDGAVASAANALAICSGGFAGGYPCSNIDLMSFIALAEFATDYAPNPEGNDIWGWTDTASGREFALMGLTSGVSFWYFHFFLLCSFNVRSNPPSPHSGFLR